MSHDLKIYSKGSKWTVKERPSQDNYPLSSGSPTFRKNEKKTEAGDVTTRDDGTEVLTGLIPLPTY